MLPICSKLSVLTQESELPHVNSKYCQKISKTSAPYGCSLTTPTIRHPANSPKTHMLCSFHDTNENFLSCSIERFNPSVFSLRDDYAERKVFFMQVQYLIFFLVAVAQQLLSLPSALPNCSYRRSLSLQAAALVWWCEEGEGIFIKHEL